MLMPQCPNAHETEIEMASAKTGRKVINLVPDVRVLRKEDNSFLKSYTYRKRAVPPPAHERNTKIFHGISVSEPLLSPFSSIHEEKLFYGGGILNPWNSPCRSGKHISGQCDATPGFSLGERTKSCPNFEWSLAGQILPWNEGLDRRKCGGACTEIGITLNQKGIIFFIGVGGGGGGKGERKGCQRTFRSIAVSSAILCKHMIVCFLCLPDLSPREK